MRRLLAALLLAPAIAAAELPLAVRDALAKAGVPESAVGAVVAPVTGGKSLLEHNAAKPLNPASAIKLVTTLAALELLGPAYTFKTEVLATAEPAGGVLAGDLVLKGGGDPKLTYERFWLLLRQLRARGIHEIRGDVILDRSFFVASPHDPSKFDGEARRAYNVGPDALLLNFKAVDFRFVPEGNGVRVLAEPDIASIEILSSLKPVKEPCGNWRRGLKYTVQENGLLATVEFTGTFPADCGERTLPLSIYDPDRYAEAMFRWLWSETGGKFLGKVRAGNAPANAKPVLRFESEPLAQLVRDVNKFSNNVMARQVYLSLSAGQDGAPGETKASEKIVRDWLASRGIAAPELVIENGAGLTRAARISAANLAGVLRAAWTSPAMPELMSSLSLFAVDGTFKLKNAAFAGRAHLKGGTLTGVQSVAGYVLTPRGERRLVVMIVNHENANRAQPALDALVEWAWKNG